MESQENDRGLKIWGFVLAIVFFIIIFWSFFFLATYWRSDLLTRPAVISGSQAEAEMSATLSRRVDELSDEVSALRLTVTPSWSSDEQQPDDSQDRSQTESTCPKTSRPPSH